MRDPRELRIRRLEDDSHPPPTDAEVKRFEKHFKVTLPPDYVRFLRLVNGGSPDVGRFKVGKRDEWAIDSFFYLAREQGPDEDDPDGWEYENLWAETRIWRPLLGKSTVPIAGDGFGNVILLNFADKPPSICVADHEAGNKLIPVARDFAAFLDMLH